MKTFALALLALGLAACGSETPAPSPDVLEVDALADAAPDIADVASEPRIDAMTADASDVGSDAARVDAASDVMACDADTQSDPMNCGRCGRACDLFQNAATTCVAGVCTLGACNRNFANCDGMAANGCETDLSSDPANCDMCGRRCTGVSLRCVANACAQ